MNFLPRYFWETGASMMNFVPFSTLTFAAMGDNLRRNTGVTI
jgi:hypothetical protein